MAILNAVPSALTAGDTWRWTKGFSDYPAPTWVVTYYFENQTKQFSSAATASGTDQAVSIASATTAALPAGRYKWHARAVSGLISEIIDGESGWLEVEPDPAAAGMRDLRSWARQTLDAIEATLLGKATADQLSMAINGRAISRIPLPDLTAWRDKLRQEVRTEENTSAGKGRFINVRLSRG